MTTSTPNQFRLYTGNNLEVLAEAFAKARLEHKEYFHQDDFFAEEKVCVATQGMRVWLEHYLVQQGNVVAGINFSFLRDAIDNILKIYEKDRDDYRPDLFKEDVLIWRIYDILKNDADDLKNLSEYLSKENGENEDVRCYQLARKLAQVYYDYIAFIPETLHPELAGAHHKKIAPADQWQLTLWQKLCRDKNGKSLISPAAALLNFLHEDARNLKRQDYGPVTFFGISAMPPHFLRVLKKFSTVQPVNFFYLNHCDDFWEDVKSKWEQDLIRAKEEQIDEHFNGNQLLANCGIQGREFFKVVLDEEAWETTELTPIDYEISWNKPDGNNAQPTPSCILHMVQQQVKSNTDRHDSQTKFPLNDWDDSITFHNCFNEIREVEVLQDCILNILSKNPDLSMNDIIVMAPDISKFAPAIQAVFGRSHLKYNFCISDRSVRNANLIAETFARILDMEKSRFELSRISSLLDSQPLCKKFQFEDSDMEILQDWFRKSGIRWGRDEKDRASEGNFEEYSWQYGLDRLLLKLAVDGRDEDGEERLSLGNLLPVDFSSSGDNLNLLKGLISLFQELRDFVDEIQESKAGNGKTIAEWCQFFTRKINVFFDTGKDSIREFSALSKTLRAIEENAKHAGIENQKIPFATIRAELTTALENPAKGEPFLNGKITFCSLLPMRGIPCKVIALLGMDAGAFPRPNDATGFNLVNRKDSKGNHTGNLLKYYNRSRSIEDRFTFLEAIMSARDYLMIFYTGQNDETLKDDLVPAAPVCELRDYIQAFCPDAKNLIVKHRLNTFDPECFKENTTGHLTAGHEPYDGTIRKAFSFDEKMGLVAQTIQAMKNSSLSPNRDQPPSPAWQKSYGLPLPENIRQSTPQERDIVIELDELEKFLKNPATRFATQRLGLSGTSFEDSPLTDYEPFATTYLEDYRLKQKLIPALAKQGAIQDSPEIQRIYRHAQSNCSLPAGEMGKLTFQEMQLNSWIINDTFRNEWTSQEESPIEEFIVDLGIIRPGQDEFILHFLESSGIPEEELNALMQFPEYRVKIHGKFKCLHTPLGIRMCFPNQNFNERLLIPLYLRHALLAAANPTQTVISKYLEEINDNQAKSLSIPATSDATEQLKRISKLYQLGQCYLFPLFENASLASVLKRTPSFTKSDMAPDLKDAYNKLFFSDLPGFLTQPRRNPTCQAILSLAQYCYAITLA